MKVSYRVKEMVHTIQGEGANSGRAVVLCRFEGCNLSCEFCDTDYTGTDGPGGGVFARPGELAAAADGLWRGDKSRKAVLCTGGEPLLQLDGRLVEAFHDLGFSVLLETNGTLAGPDGVDWMCVSPKDGGIPVIRKGNELKLPFPVDGVDPEVYLGLDFTHFYLQPVWGNRLQSNIRKAVEYCLAHPSWKLSLQMHKYIGIP